MKLSRISHYATTRHRMMWLIIMGISLMGMIDIPPSAVVGLALAWKYLIVISICAFKSTFLTLLLVCCERKKALSIIAKTIVAIYSIICILNGIVYGLYDIGITTKLVTIIGQTNRNEIQEFIPTFYESFAGTLSNPLIYAAAGILIVFIAFLVKLNRKTFVLTSLSISGIGLVTLISTLTILSEGRTVFFPTLRLGRAIILAYKENILMKQGLGKLTMLPAASSVESNRYADVVIVVGESASRERLSLYGYPLATTPELDALKDSLIIFDDVIGTSTTTAINMRRILTFLSDRDDTEEWYQSPMLVALMNKAGYSTAWLSNQEKCGMWGNSTAIMVSMACDIRYLSGIDNTDVSLQNYDEVLLPELSDVLQRDNGPKFVGLHLMGSHRLYNRRYPEYFAVFSSDSVGRHNIHQGLSSHQTKTVAEYLNSLLYTDFILSQIIGMVAERERPTIMIYLSDHGENVYDDGDNFTGRDSKHVQVPFIIYVNSRFKEQYPILTERLKDVSHRAMTTAEIPHLICTLTGTSYHMYTDSLDVTSTSFNERWRYVDGEPWEFEHARFK